MVDQLAASWLPAYGHDVVQAPNLTRLAREGVTFESAYCPAPLCLPSRAGLLTGKLPSRVGVYDNASELPALSPTVAHHLRTLGYATSLVGKMHFVGPDQLHINLAERSTTADLRREFRDAVAARWDPGVLEQEVLESQRERQLVAQALAIGRHTSWDHQPHVDAATQYVRSGPDMYELQRRARLDTGGTSSRN